MFPRPLLIAPLLMLAANCSSTSGLVAAPQAEMPPPPSTLIAACPDAILPPDPLIDPERLAWEADTLAKLAGCKLLHSSTIKAWQDAVKARNTAHPGN